MSDYANIAERLRAVHVRIADAVRASGRSPEDVRLIAVSKTYPAEAVQAALSAGQRAFGENQVQEGLRKIAASDPAIEWHLIGHLQSNKAKLISGHFHWLHSLDSLTTAAKLARATAERATSLQTLIQVNVTADPAKSGINPQHLFAFLDELMLQEQGGLRLRGLMTIGPYEADEAELRRAFARLRELRDACVQRFGLPDFNELSMGMSEDFESAIAEGATLVRIGRGVFGRRALKLKR